MIEPLPAIKNLSLYLARDARGRGKDRRETKRYNKPLVICFVLTPAGPEEAQVMNLSAQGACLVLSKRVPPDSLLALHLSNSEQLCARAATLRVSHCTGQAGGPWFVGGPFAEPLPPDVLPILLR